MLGVEPFGIAGRLLRLRVLRDVVEKWETPERAEDIFGVVFIGALDDDSLAVDEAATAARREALGS